MAPPALRQIDNRLQCEPQPATDRIRDSIEGTRLSNDPTGSSRVATMTMASVVPSDSATDSG